MAGQNTEGEVLREVHLKISPQYATIVVVPKAEEARDKQFPHNLHNAAELFLRAGMVENAEKLKDSTDKMISLYADNPDGKTGVMIGQGCVCWNCGFCGLPKDFKEENTKSPPGPCSGCNESEQINWLRVTQKQGTKVSDMPWIEVTPLSEEEAKKKKDAVLAAKRAEVEAGVKKAIEERAAAEKSAKKE